MLRTVTVCSLKSTTVSILEGAIGGIRVDSMTWFGEQNEDKGLLRCNHNGLSSGRERQDRLSQTLLLTQVLLISLGCPLGFFKLLMFKKPGTVSSVLWEVKTKIEGTLSFRYGNAFDSGRQIEQRKTNLR